jgi:4-hydroxybenzoate polyprenyltransferase
VARARRKRKERGGGASKRESAPRERETAPPPRERMERGYARAEERNREAREALEPLASGERPPVVTLGAIVSALIAASVAVSYLAGVEVEGDKPQLAQALAPALLMTIMAWGMWRARYWAVLGFQLLLVVLIFSAVFGLAAEASSVTEVAATLGLLAVSGTFFYFMVKAMARIQMPTRR